MPKPIHKYNIHYTPHKKSSNCCVLILDNIMWFIGYIGGLCVGCAVSCSKMDIESGFEDDITEGFLAGEKYGEDNRKSR
jgi:hypothetical protein